MKVNNINSAFLLLGSNMGNREEFLNKAIELIGKQVGFIKKKSSLYNTAAWGKNDQNDFLNQVVFIETNSTAQKLLSTILKIEQTLGRKRNEKWAERTIDIDILYFNREILNSKTLTVPHPLIQDRRFALLPLSEIAPNYVHPVLHKNASALLKVCNDKLEVIKLTKLL